MRSIFFFLFLIAAGFAVGYGAARSKTIERISSKMAALPGKERPAEFRPTQYAAENLPFCAVIVGRNNGAFVEKTLESVFSQSYENFRVVYVDDASDDGSADLARELVYASPRFTRVEFHRNEQPLGTLASLARAVKECEDREIVVVLDEDGWLAHEWVFSRLNQYYADPDLWLGLGQSCEYPTYRLGPICPLQEDGKTIRTKTLLASHLKTFYAGLFKKISDADLQDKGEWFQGASPLIYILPMLEMAQGHSQCLTDVLFISNRESLKEGDDLETLYEAHIRSLKPYPRLASLDLPLTQRGIE